MAEDKTEYARSLDYNGPAPVLVQDGRVVSCGNKDWFLFCEDCRQEKYVDASFKNLVLYSLPQYGCVVGVMGSVLYSVPMSRDGSWCPEEMCEVSDLWAGCDENSVSRDDVALEFLIDVNALLGSSFKLSDFGRPWGDAKVHIAVPENA